MAAPSAAGTSAAPASRLVEKSAEAFADALAAKVSVPGGGGAAAYAGALAVALGSMAGNFTVGKKRYADVEEDLQRLLAQGEDVRRCLLELVDEDAAAFEPLSRAYAIAKEDATRSEVLERETRKACAAPLRMMEQTCRAIELLEEMAGMCSPLMVSDVACGSYLAQAALQAAGVNVLVNTRAFASRDWAKAAQGRADGLLGEFVPRAGACAAGVLGKLRS